MTGAGGKTTMTTVRRRLALAADGASGGMHRKPTQDAALRERVKELTCLYGLVQLVERPGLSLAEILRGAADLLPGAWQYPEVAAARITLDENVYATREFVEGAQVQKAPLVVGGRRRGSVEVAYIETRPALDEGPFLREERSLIDAVARQIGLIVERRQAEEEQARLQYQLRHADRLATIGQLAAGVAHELNEPLGHILGFAQLSQKSPGLPEPVAQDLAKIVRTCLHARQIITNLLLFSRQMPPQKTWLNLNEVLEEGLGLLECRCARAGIHIARHLATDLPEIFADGSQLRQVFVDLAVNAIHAMPAGGVLEVSTALRGNRVVLGVRDNGIGMSHKVLKEIFIPFFTTKDVNEGTGLGLPVVHGIVTAHGGSIQVDSAPERGAFFQVELPISPPGGSQRKAKR